LYHQYGLVYFASVEPSGTLCRVSRRKEGVEVLDFKITSSMQFSGAEHPINTRGMSGLSIPLQDILPFAAEGINESL